MDKLICSKYAKALFELAKEKDICSKIENEVQQLLDCLNDKGNKDFKRLLAHPDIDGGEKLKVIKSAFELDNSLEGFLSLIFQRGRGNMLTDILAVYREMSREHRNIATAEIATPVELTKAQTDRLVAVLEKKLNKTIEPKVVIDPSLIGGLKITVCGNVINSTIKSRLNNLKSMLAEGHL